MRLVTLASRQKQCQSKKKKTRNNEIDATQTQRTLGIDIPAQTRKVEISGTHVIPEFPVNLTVIMAIGLIGVLLALRLKLTVLA